MIQKVLTPSLIERDDIIYKTNMLTATIAYKQNNMDLQNLADEEREQRRRKEIEHALKRAEERSKKNKKSTFESISSISSIC